uniref:hypothetical protein n=1 Tax=Luteimonas sp. 4-12 TaxID=2027406 RepID=UPI001E44A6BA|nr:MULTISPECIES: hypothetical protein [Luteimonas]
MPATSRPAVEERRARRVGVDITRRQARAQRRHHGHRDQHRGEDRGRDRDRDVGVQLAGLLLDQQDRREHQDRGQRRRQHRLPHALHAFDRRLEAFQPAPPRLVDALQHDDGVVDGHADRKRDAGHRDHVERAPGQQQADERGDRADRNRDDAGQRRPARAQEREHHQRRQQRAEREVGPDIGHRVLDVAHVVAGQRHLQPQRRQQLGVDALDLGQRRVLDVDDVGPGLATDRQAQRRLAVVERQVAALEVVERDGAHVAQPHQRAVALGDHQLVDGVDLGEAADGAHQVAALAGVEVAGGAVDVAQPHRVAHVGHRQAARREPRGV